MKHTSLLPWLALSFSCLLAPMGLHATPRVVEVVGDELTILIENNPALAADLRVGDSATVFYSMQVEGQRVEVRVAEILIEAIEGLRLKARVRVRRADLRAGYEVWFHRERKADPGGPVMAKGTGILPRALPGEPSGSIHVASDPTGGEVWLDGLPVPGRTPISLEGLRLGAHVVSVRVQGRTVASEVTIRAGRPAVVEARLSAAQGKLSLDSEPSGARVRLDGVERCTTPCQLDGLAPGKHLAQFDMSGYVSLTRVVDVGEGEAPPIKATLAPAGRLRISGVPPDASVVIDKRQRCLQLPCIVELAPGAHAVRVTRPGRVPTGRVVTTRASELAEWEVALPRLPEVRVDASPEGAEVFLDDEPIGESPMAFALEQFNPVRVRVAHEGYREVAFEVIPRPNETEHLSPRLAPIEAPRSRGWVLAGQICTFTGVAMLAGGGTLLFLADRNNSLADDRHQIYESMPQGGPASAYSDAWARMEDARDASRVQGISGMALLGAGLGTTLFGVISWLDPFGLDEGTTPTAGSFGTSPERGGLSLHWRQTW